MFLKSPRPGSVKTRLAAGLDAEAAAAIAVVLIDRTMAALSEFGGRVELRFTPDDAGDEIRRWGAKAWRAVPQGEGDLGQRLERAVAAAFAEGETRVLVVGTDCPGLSAEDLDEALRILEDRDVVLGPSEDGGYWLIGLRLPLPELFAGVAWSTDTVCETTRRRAVEGGRSVGLLRRQLDVDTLEDWRRWLREQPL